VVVVRLLDLEAGLMSLVRRFLIGILLVLSALGASVAIAATSEKPKILIVSPEQKGILQLGGLGHATADLARSLKLEGYDVEVLMPFYLEMGATETRAIGQSYIKLFYFLRMLRIKMG
jgi:hypothetical protein